MRLGLTFVSSLQGIGGLSELSRAARAYGTVIRRAFIRDDSTLLNSRPACARVRDARGPGTSPAVINHFGISGGKDSTALLLWAVYESGYPRETIRASFCDTGNEHEFTYAHVRMLSEKVHPIVWLKPERDFYDLAIWKGRFPSTKVRFCTTFLKTYPTIEHLKELRAQDPDREVLAHSGVRADESVERSQLSEREFDTLFACEVYRPLLRWKFEDVLAIHDRYGIPLNPLYSYGASRVGCFPCIMSRKYEVRAIAEHFPERIDMIRQRESEFQNLNGVSTFFPRRTVPPRFRSKAIKTKSGAIMTVATIDDVVRWSQTDFKTGRPPIKPKFCATSLGACE